MRNFGTKKNHWRIVALHDLVWPLPLAQVLPGLQVIFPFKTWFFGIYLNFQRQKGQYLPHSESKSYQINSIKFCSSRSFQQHQRHIPIPPKFSVTILFNFQWRNHSIFKNFCTTSPNAMEPRPCTPPRWELSKDTPGTFSEASRFGGSHIYKTKQNKLPSFIDRCLYWGSLCNCSAPLCQVQTESWDIMKPHDIVI